jgi:tetratricopeptide (TPR) repeat protein
MESNPLGLYNFPSPILLLFAMKYLPLLGCTAALIFFADAAVAKSPAEIEAIARSTSIEIQVMGQDRVGSGVIIHRKGDLYTLITNRHVACGSRSCRLPAQQIYQLGTSDGQRYRVPVTSVKLMGGDLDLAIVQFRSNRSYLVAQVAEPGSLKVDDDVYTAGFPVGQGWLFGAGKAKAVVSKRLVGDGGGYTVVYDAETLPGMSGGGAFDRNGRLVAVHGYGDRFTKNTEAEEVSSNTVRQEVNSKVGYNRGIPVRWVVQGLGELGILVGNRQSLKQVQLGNPAVAATADEFFISGFNKVVDPGQDFQAGRRDAVAQLNRAVALNPRYTTAYFLRAYVKNQLNDSQGALADFNQTISLNSQYAEAYNNRGLLKFQKLNNPQGALADYNQAISLNPNYATAYYNRGVLKVQKLNDSQGALADYNQAISLNSNYADAYNNRGNLKKDKLNDPQGALTDYNQAISLNPNYANAYNNRGNLKKDKLNDPQGALADYNRAISLNPKLATAYYNRGILKKNQLNDPQAIALNPNYADAYINRGILKVQKLSDTLGAIADFRTAAKLARTQGQTQSLQRALEALRILGATENP